LIGTQEPVVDRRNLSARSRRPCGPGMFHDKITTHAGGKAGPAGMRRTALAPDAISRVPAAALHGPGHWHHAAPDEVPWIVRRWLRGHPQTQTSCVPMPSRPPPEGPMTFRPCPDARADKTDLHAYDGDRPKLSHPTERRLGERLSRAHDIVDCAAIPGYCPADRQPSCIFIHRRPRRELTILPRWVIWFRRADQARR
jgi:hypothetical protein